VTGIIHVFDEIPEPGKAPQPNRDPGGTLRHEARHAIDHYLGDISQTPGFKAAYRADRDAAIDPKIKQDDAYYLSDPQEAFAEAAGRIMGKKPPGALSNSTRYIQRLPEFQRLMALPGTP